MLRALNLVNRLDCFPLPPFNPSDNAEDEREESATCAHYEAAGKVAYAVTSLGLLRHANASSKAASKS